MNSVLEKFNSLEKDVYALLAPAGFKKNKKKFRSDKDEVVVVVALQKSRSSTASSIEFTINASIYLKRLLDPEYDDVENLSDYGGHCYWRIGNMLEIPSDLWWRIEDRADATDTNSEVLKAVRGTMLPFLAKLSSERAVLELWQSGSCPGRSEKQRLQYLNALQAL
jgi:Domain of unknown function (DUF4304)